MQIIAIIIIAIIIMIRILIVIDFGFKKFGLSDICVLVLFSGLSDIGLSSIGLSNKNHWPPGKSFVK